MDATATQLHGRKAAEHNHMDKGRATAVPAGGVWKHCLQPLWLTHTTPSTINHTCNQNPCFMEKLQCSKPCLIRTSCLAPPRCISTTDQAQPHPLPPWKAPPHTYCCPPKTFASSHHDSHHDIASVAHPLMHHTNTRLIFLPLAAQPSVPPSGCLGCHRPAASLLIRQLVTACELRRSGGAEVTWVTWGWPHQAEAHHQWSGAPTAPKSAAAAAAHSFVSCGCI